MDARTQIRSVFRNMLKIQDAAGGPLPPQGTPVGGSKQAFCVASADSACRPQSCGRRVTFLISIGRAAFLMVTTLRETGALT